MMHEKDCPICNEKVISDANLFHYCALCGMSVEEKMAVVKEVDGEERYFCNDACLDTYKEFLAK